MPQSETSAELSDLIARCALGDSAAFDLLYKKTSPKLYGIALRLLMRRSWAEEVLQDGYAKIWLKAESYNAAKSSPLTWMTSIVRNQAIDVLRHVYRGQIREVEWSSAKDRRISEDNPSIKIEIRQLLLDCLARLSQQQRQCFLKSYLEGFTPMELARSLGVPLGTVKTRLRRGLARLRECLRS